MNQRIFVSFESDFADDSVEGPTGNVVTPGGKSVMGCIADKLKERGVIVTSVHQHSFYGWAFTAEHQGVKFYCLVQHLRLWLLTVRPILSIGDRFLFRGRTAETHAFVDLAVKTLASDSHFMGIIKQSEKEFNATQRSRTAKS